MAVDRLTVICSSYCHTLSVLSKKGHAGNAKKSCVPVLFISPILKLTI